MPVGYNANMALGPNQVVPQNVQPLFPQPQGNVYNINSTLEVANVPVGAGISIALCLPENVMFIKTMQNGNPLFYPYKILPFNDEQEQKETSKVAAPTLEELNNQLKEHENKILSLTKKLSSILKKENKGGFDI